MKEDTVKSLEEKIKNAKLSLNKAEEKIKKVPKAIIKNVEDYIIAKELLEQSKRDLEHYISHCTECGEWIDERDACGCEWSH